MKYLEYLQIKSAIEQEKQKDGSFGLTSGIISIILSLALYIALDWVIIPTTILAIGLSWTLLGNYWNFIYKRRLNKLDELYDEKIDAEEAAQQVFSIKETNIVLTK